VRRAAGSLAGSVIFGAVFGSAMGGLGALAERYPQQGLHALALHHVVDAASAYLAIAVAAGLSAALLRRAAAPLARTLGSPTREMMAVGVWLTASLPVWGLVAIRDPWLLPPRRAVLYVAGALLLILHVLVYYALRRRRRRRGSPLRSRFAGIAASLCLLGVGGLWASDRLAVAVPRSEAEQPNVLLVVLDTVRADRLSCYGYARHTTPELDAFAREAIRYTEFYATSSWTIPSHASLFTGLFPVRHGATQENLILGRGVATLAEVLRNAGYRTWGASGNPYVGDANQMSQGFEEFVETWRDDPRESAPGPVTHPNNTSFEAFLSRAARDRPFFAFVNYMDAHSPYLPPEADLRRFVPSRAERAHARRLALQRWADHYVDEPFAKRDLALRSALYDAELAYLSRSVGELLDALRTDGRLANTWIAITSDHGEHFGENGHVEHMFGLYNTAVRIPLVIRPQGLRRGKVDHRKGQIVDLFPTILNAAGVEHDGIEQHGIDLLAPGSERDAIFSEYYFPSQVLSVLTPEERRRGAQRLAAFQRRLRAIQMNGQRLIWSSNGHHELYDLRGDPGETRNLFDPQAPPAAYGSLAARLDGYLQSYGGGGPARAPGPRPGPDEQRVEALRALGYAR
jgi:arylsulfatase A-like enzyme